MTTAVKRSDGRCDLIIVKTSWSLMRKAAFYFMYFGYWKDAEGKLLVNKVNGSFAQQQNNTQCFGPVAAAAH